MFCTRFFNGNVITSRRVGKSQSNEVTHQADEKEENLEAPTGGGDADNVPVTDGGHGHHEEVDAVPVRERLRARRLEVGGVALVLQLGWRTEY